MKIFGSFSGGRSSALMCKEIMTRYPKAKKVFVMANTGQETRPTMTFARMVDEYFGLNLVLVEGVTHSDQRKSSTHKVVSFAKASMDGRPFAGMISKYGIPNLDFPHCTRELKLNPMYSYLKSIGWKPGTYKIALGIRADEPKRVNPNAKKLGLIYPLVEAGIDKMDVLSFWQGMPFDLEQPEHEGNCKFCFKKSELKTIINIKNHRDWFDFPKRMEREFSHLRTDRENFPRVFFRGYRSTKEMLALADSVDPPDPRILPRPEENNGCAESCEVFGDF